MAVRKEVVIADSLQRKINYRRQEILARKFNRLLPTLIFSVSAVILLYLLHTRW